MQNLMKCFWPVLTLLLVFTALDWTLMSHSADARARGGERLQGPARPLGVLVDPLLVRGPGPAVLDEGRGRGDLVSIGLGVGQHAAEERPAVGVAALPGQCQQHRPLALAQIITGGLAGAGRVAEDAELVVAQLEGDPGGLAQFREPGGGLALGREPAQDRADEQGAHDGVAGRLAAHHRQGGRFHCLAGGNVVGILVGQGQGLGPHIQVLAERHLLRHGVEGGPRRRTGRGRALGQGGPELGARGGQEQVAQEDRRAAAVRLGVAEPAGSLVRGGEAAVGSGQAPAGERGVDDVVVDEGARLVELQGRAQPSAGPSAQDLLAARALGRGGQADGGQHRAHPLAAPQQISGGVEELARGGSGVGPLVPPLGDRLRDALVHGLAHEAHRAVDLRHGARVVASRPGTGRRTSRDEVGRAGVVRPPPSASLGLRWTDAERAGNKGYNLGVARCDGGGLRPLPCMEMRGMRGAGPPPSRFPT